VRKSSPPPALTRKRDFVRLLGADHVFDSRSLAFADEVLRPPAARASM